MQTMNYEEAAEFLKIKAATLRNWVAARKLPYHKAGRRVIFFREELEQWILKGSSDEKKDKG